MSTQFDAIVYSENGDPGVLHLTQSVLPPVSPGRVVIRMEASGINPTDVKSRQGGSGVVPDLVEPVVPHHDGAGVVVAVGAGVNDHAVGERVWVVLAGYQSPSSGTAQQFASVLAERVFHLPDDASFEVGASLGVPALTAHRALTVGEGFPARIAPGSLSGKTILVPGGAGAVGHAAIQLASRAGALVISTVSSAAKATLARAAGADLVIDYTSTDVVGEIRAVAPKGVDLVVEVAASANQELNLAVLAPRGTIAVYGNDRGGPLGIDFFASVTLNLRYQFVLLYTVGAENIRAAGEDIIDALAFGSLGVGEAEGLPITRFALRDTADAHRAVEAGTVGKVLITEF
jgi:NADPH2:quinone reductase